MAPSERVRCFVAVRLDEAIRRRISEVGGAVRGETRGIRPVGLGNLHLTLKFLGEIPQGDVADAFEIIRTTAGGECAFDSVVGGLGVFPPRGRPRVVWVGMSDPDGALERLHRGLDRGFCALGVRGENRRYTPHVTLARLRGSSGAAGLTERLDGAAAEDLGVQRVKELALVMSELLPTGARYIDLGLARLRPE